MIRFVLPLLAALGVALPVAAQQLPSSLVDAEARWVAHVDVGAVFGSELLRNILAAEDVDLSSTDLSEMASAWGLEPGRDLRSITVYGTEVDPELAVALVSGSSALSKAIDHLLVAMKRTDVTSSGITLQRWSEREGGDDSVFTYMASKADTDERVLIVSTQPEQVARAVSVVRGERASIQSSNSAMSRAPAPGTMFYATVSEDLLGQLDLDVDGDMNITEMIHAVRVEFGEHSENTFLDARVSTAQPEQATQLLALIEGGRAFVQLAAMAEPEARQALPLLQHLKVDREANDLHVRFEYPTGELMTLLRDLSGEEFEYTLSSDVGDFRSVPESRPRSAGSSGWR